uniref:Uncharacterized protein n=1 Tax=Vespula pensylvanica TaxID=30213 RepID=A0A834P176_VESPE|nr:hypothetical protein H0235_009167 [Vespula pensylvanica]
MLLLTLNSYHGTEQIRSETAGNGWSISETGSNNRMISVLETNGRSTIIIMIIPPGGSSCGNQILETAPYRFAISADGSGSAKLYGLCEPGKETERILTLLLAVELGRGDASRICNFSILPIGKGLSLSCEGRLTLENCLATERPHADTLTFDECSPSSRGPWLSLPIVFRPKPRSWIYLDGVTSNRSRETRDSHRPNFAKADDGMLVDCYFLTIFTFIVFLASSRNLLCRGLVAKDYELEETAIVEISVGSKFTDGTDIEGKFQIIARYEVPPDSPGAIAELPRRFSFCLVRVRIILVPGKVCSDGTEEEVEKKKAKEQQRRRMERAVYPDLG